MIRRILRSAESIPGLPVVGFDTEEFLCHSSFGSLREFHEAVVVGSYSHLLGSLMTGIAWGRIGGGREIFMAVRSE